MKNEGMKIKFTFIFVEKLIQSKGPGLNCGQNVTYRKFHHTPIMFTPSVRVIKISKMVHFLFSAGSSNKSVLAKYLSASKDLVWLI